ncbi:MAG: SUMF1/EgtB/PvdO family nonheme iron enzyme [Gemmataceae bacterium]
MSAVQSLITFGIRQLLGANAASLADQFFKLREDKGQALQAALVRANDRTWKAVEMSLRGESIVEQCRRLVMAGDAKAIGDLMKTLTAAIEAQVPEAADKFREACFSEFQQAKKQGLMSWPVAALSAIDIRSGESRRFDSSNRVLTEADAALRGVAEAMPELPNLRRFLSMKLSSGSSILVAGFSYFLRSEVEANAELARGLQFEAFQSLAKDQSLAFGQIGQMLDALGDRFSTIMDEVGHVRTSLESVAGDTQEMRKLMADISRKLSENGIREAKSISDYSRSFSNEHERRIVAEFKQRFRQLSNEQQKTLESTLVGLGKLEAGAGMLREAESTFREVARNSADTSTRAAALFDAYQVALEQDRLDEALSLLQEAALLDPGRYLLFPRRYRPLRILGVGGFGVAVFCQDENREEAVVLKAMHAAVMDRRVGDIFGEARVLQRLVHPAIIRVRDWDYADPDRTRPFLVMEYFEGSTLAARLKEKGPLDAEDFFQVATQVAEALQEAHRQKILHRDLKPENVLVRRHDSTWEVKVIDFGLAYRLDSSNSDETSKHSRQTVLGASIAGTRNYAPPEQTGDLPGVPLGPYSDIFAFAKLCLQVLFETLDPFERHWRKLPDAVSMDLKLLLEDCRAPMPAERVQSFEDVLAKLRDLERKLGSKVPSSKSEASTKAAAIKTKQVPRSAASAPASPSPAPQPERRVAKNKIGMEFVWIPAGNFLMGSPPEEFGREEEETQHRVMVSRGFFLGIHPVTQEQWYEVMGYNPSRKMPKERRPVVNVSWDDCQLFCQTLEGLDGNRYRLPTEAEWEYSCRAEATTAFCFGDAIGTDLANYDGRKFYGREKPGLYRRKTTPVGSFEPNQWGLFDVHGNVWEWCEDDYDELAYHAGERTDPLVRNVITRASASHGIVQVHALADMPSANQEKVLRGGCYANDPRHCRSAYREREVRSHRDNGIGFRVVMEIVRKS